MNHFDTRIQSQLANAGRRPRALWLVALVGALATAGAAAQLPLTTTIEDCLESGTDLVTLPGTAGGSLSASQCRGCQSLQLKFDRRTQYYIGKELVPYAQLREAAAKGSYRLDLFYHPQTKILTRVRLAASGKGQ